MLNMLFGFFALLDNVLLVLTSPQEMLGVLTRVVCCKFFVCDAIWVRVFDDANAEDRPFDVESVLPHPTSGSHRDFIPNMTKMKATWRRCSKWASVWSSA